MAKNNHRYEKLQKTSASKKVSNTKNGIRRKGRVPVTIEKTYVVQKEHRRETRCKLHQSKCKS